MPGSSSVLRPGGTGRPGTLRPGLLAGFWWLMKATVAARPCGPVATSWVSVAPESNVPA